MGNYERFLDITLTRDNNLTTGKVYQVSRISYIAIYPYQVICALQHNDALAAALVRACRTLVAV